MATESDPVNQEVSDQIFGGCFNVVILFVLVTGGFVLSSTYLLLN